MMTYAENLADPGGPLRVIVGKREAPAVFRGDLDRYALLGFGHHDRTFPPGLNYGRVPVYTVESETGLRFVFVRTDPSSYLDWTTRRNADGTKRLYIPDMRGGEYVTADGRDALFRLWFDFADGELGRLFYEFANRD